jgi:hypothetical protein
MTNKLVAIAVLLMAGTSSVMALSVDDANAAVKKWSGYDVDALQKESSALNGQDSYPFCIVKQDGKLMRTVFPDKSKLGEDVTGNTVVAYLASSVPPTGVAKITYTWDGKNKESALRSIKDMGGTVDGFCGYSYLVSAPVAPTDSKAVTAPTSGSPVVTSPAAPASSGAPASTPAASTPAVSSTPAVAK